SYLGIEVARRFPLTSYRFPRLAGMVKFLKALFSARAIYSSPSTNWILSSCNPTAMANTNIQAVTKYILFNMILSVVGMNLFGFYYSYFCWRDLRRLNSPSLHSACDGRFHLPFHKA